MTRRVQPTFSAAQPDTAHPPHEWGRLRNAEQIATEVYSGCVSAQWVTRYLKAGRYKAGHCTLLWWDGLVRAAVRAETLNQQEELCRVA